MLDIETIPSSPVIVTHPFTNSGVVGFSGYNKPENILDNHNALLRWQKEMNKQISEFDSAVRIFLYLTKPYRLVFLKYAEPYLSRKDFSQILSDVWIQTEVPYSDPNFSTGDLVKLFKKADPVISYERR